MTLVCVTNQLPDITPCTVHNEHDSFCDGWQEGRGKEHWVPCRGCLPKEASTGHLCWNCFESARKAILESTTFMESFVVTRQDTGGIRTQAEGYINLPAAALVRDELNSFLKSFPGSTEAWASTLAGAEDAVRFTRRFNAAKLAYPLEDKPKRLGMRCPICELKSLMWTPPARLFDALDVTCQNPECGHVLHDEEIGEEVRL